MNRNYWWSLHKRAEHAKLFPVLTMPPTVYGSRNKLCRSTDSAQPVQYPVPGEPGPGASIFAELPWRIQASLKSNNGVGAADESLGKREQPFQN
jgi:hypothetical protein